MRVDRFRLRRVLALGLPLVGAAVLTAWGLGGGAAESADPLIEVQRSPFVRRVNAAGEIRSANSAVVGCPSIPRTWNFTITELAPEGQSVRAGTTLVRFDDRRLQEELQVKRSELETQRKELEKTTLEEQEKLERMLLELAELKAKKARLVQKLTVPAELLERVELEKTRIDDELADEELRLVEQRTETQRANMTARVETARNRVLRLKREVAQYETNIGRMTVPAPRDGFVVHVADWNGQKPKAGESVWMGRGIAEVADLTRMEVAGEVAEPDAGFVEAGQTVEIRLDASPGRLFSGRVERLGRLFRPKSAEVPSMVFDAVISIDEPDPELMRPGMAASVEILAPAGEELIHLPEDAVGRVGGEPVVERLRPGGGAETVAVRLGPRWNGRVVIESGLAVGDRVRARPAGS